MQSDLLTKKYGSINYTESKIEISFLFKNNLDYSVTKKRLKASDALKSYEEIKALNDEAFILIDEVVDSKDLRKFEYFVVYKDNTIEKIVAIEKKFTQYEEPEEKLYTD